MPLYKECPYKNYISDKKKPFEIWKLFFSWRNQLLILNSTDVLRENTEAVFSACDAAHGRWAKLLGVRALIHPKLRLQEFLSIYNITQDFITTTEKVFYSFFFYKDGFLQRCIYDSQIGGRLGYSIRGTLQSQSKSFVDFQHDFRVGLFLIVDNFFDFKLIWTLLSDICLCIIFCR